METKQNIDPEVLQFVMGEGYSIFGDAIFSIDTRVLYAVHTATMMVVSKNEAPKNLISFSLYLTDQITSKDGVCAVSEIAEWMDCNTDEALQFLILFCVRLINMEFEEDVLCDCGSPLNEEAA